MGFLTNILVSELVEPHAVFVKCQMQKHRIIPCLLILFFVLMSLLGLPAVIAQEGNRLDISSVDVSQFPEIRLTFIATDAESRRLPDVAGIELRENGTPIADFQVTDEPVGTELTFVIDANSTFNNRDDAGGLSRREKVRDSIVRYASQFMDVAQLDRVSIIVPAADSPTVLLDQAVFPNAVINEVNFYEPTTVDTTPMNEMLMLALDRAAESHQEGRFQAIVLFSDGANLDQQLDYPALIAKAQAINVPIFSAILGARADENEIENVQNLALPTRGSFVHMPDPGETDPIYDLVQAHRSQYQLAYRSQLAASGSHQIALDLAGAHAEAVAELDLAPPLAEIMVDNSRPIRRVVSTPDEPLTLAEPVKQPIVVHISWPDGHPRMLSYATLTVNGTPQPPVTVSDISPDGLLTLDWDIANLDDGTYELFVEVGDELGLTSQSEALPMAIVVEGTAEVSPNEPETALTTTESDASSDETEGFLQNVGIIGLVLGLLALIVAVVIFGVAIVLLRRRRTARTPASAPVTPAGQPPHQVDHDATQIIMPAFASRSSSNAYLEPLENVPEHQVNIPVKSSNVTIGRDPSLAEIVFADKSVSRLHARIMESNGVFQLYDEGSASGTYINFQQISLRPQALNDKDDVHFGRVHVRFHVEPVADDADATQVMQPPIGPVQGEPARENEDYLSTQPYIQHQPSAGQPPDDRDTPRRSGPPSSTDDEDDVSTQPYMPHSPKR